MNYHLVELSQTYSRSVLDDFVEAITDRELHYMASTLENVGFEPSEEITHAVERAMRICNNCGVPVREHFKTIYIADDAQHTVKKDWKLSKLAYSLAMLNGATDNPMVGRIQLEILSRYF